MLEHGSDGPQFRAWRSISGLLWEPRKGSTLCTTILQLQGLRAPPPYSLSSIPGPPNLLNVQVLLGLGDDDGLNAAHKGQSEQDALHGCGGFCTFALKQVRLSSGSWSYL